MSLSGKSWDFYTNFQDEYGLRVDAQKEYLASVDDILISKIPHTNFSWLDVGTGDGSRILDLSRKLDACVDVVEETDLIKRYGLASEFNFAFQGKFENFPSFVARYDVVSFLWNVLGHVDNPQLVLSKAHRLLKSGGILFFDVPSMLNVDYGFWRVVRNSLLFSRSSFVVKHSPQGHLVRFFSQSLLREFLQSAGFRKIEFHYVSKAGRKVYSGFRGQIICVAKK